MNILNLDITEIIWRLKLTSISLSVIFGFIFVYFFVKFNKLLKFKMALVKSLYNPPEASGGAVQSKWEEIMRHAESSRESDWKLGIIEADKLVDDLLKLAGYHGETMGDRLMSIEKGQLESLEAIWYAHKIRNKLVHDSNYFLRSAEAVRAIEAYRRAFEELQAIK